MNIRETAERLRQLSYHVCAQCLESVKAGTFRGREGDGTRMTVMCHGRVMTAIVRDAAVEDSARVWWFDKPDDGVPFETPAQRRKRLLGEELERVRTARDRNNHDKGI